MVVFLLENKILWKIIPNGPCHKLLLRRGRGVRLKATAEGLGDYEIGGIVFEFFHKLKLLIMKNKCDFENSLEIRTKYMCSFFQTRYFMIIIPPRPSDAKTGLERGWALVKDTVISAGPRRLFLFQSWVIIFHKFLNADFCLTQEQTMKSHENSSRTVLPLASKPKISRLFPWTLSLVNRFDKNQSYWLLVIEGKVSLFGLFRSK